MSDDAEHNNDPNAAPKREPWYSYILDPFLWFGELIFWLIGGIFRLIGWLFLAAFEGCS